MKKSTLIIGLLIILAFAGCSSLPKNGQVDSINKKPNSNNAMQSNLIKIEDIIDFKGEKRDWVSAINVSASNADFIKTKNAEGYYLQDNMSKTNGFKVFDKNDNEIGSIIVFNNAKWENDLIKALEDEKSSDEEGLIGLPNPASLYCEENGGVSEIRKNEDGEEYGVCIFEDGSECEEWAYLNGECLRLTLDTETPEDVCEDLCGDGQCQEIVCQAIGCPCPESKESCSIDCQ